MIAKVTRGASGRGLIRYLLGPGKANEHTDQRVITSGLVLGGEALAGADLSGQEIADWERHSTRPTTLTARIRWAGISTTSRCRFPRGSPAQR